ncbi:MAG: ECF transporter S component [Clostridia bacterium]|nr:ECF transporter S component [Clostridia bacterium]MBQ6183584.1 ECF transporter S component [Clostridia bacterium]
MKNERIKKLAVIAIFSALAFVLMLIEFSTPVIPSFVKLDFSEIPALLAAFLFGPLEGIAVCLVKNVIHLAITSTGGVGELANFLLGAAFAGTAGLVYRFKHTFWGGFWGCVSGSVAMAMISFPVNLFVTYPFYANLFFKGDMQGIIEMYKALLPSSDTLVKSLLIFNTPFNFVKGLLVSAVVMLCYKRLSVFYKNIGSKKKSAE